MTWSLGEIRSLSAKAAKGCGMPWGLAEEAGFAVEWLEARAAPGVAALAGYLDAIAVEPGWQAQSCPIALGARISDSGNPAAAFPATVFQPLLVVPFIAAVADKENFELANGAGSCVIGKAGPDGELDALVSQAGTCRCSLRECDNDPQNLQCSTRVPDSFAPFVGRLGFHAEKTYAPATEESRLKGAGAGLNDND